MKNFFKKLNFVQNDIYYYLCLAAIVLTYGLNIWLNLLLYVLFTVNLAANIKKDKLFYTFIALMIFEPQVHSTLVFSPIMLSSLMKVYYIIFIVRVLIDIFSRTRYKFDWTATLLALIFITTSFAYQSSFSSGASYMLKTAGVVLYMLFYLRANTERDEMLGEMLSVIALFMLMAGIYGLTRGIYWDNRLGSTIPDPNYSAMYFAIGLVASFNATLLKKWMRIVVSVGLVGLMLMTMSLTGMMLTALVLVIYFFITQGFKRVALVLGVIVLLIGTILILPSHEDTKFNHLQNRISKFYVIDETDYTFEGKDDYTDGELYFNYITNNRYYLAESYIREFKGLPKDEQMFGGNNTVSGPFRDKMVEAYTTVSHNTYIDLMYMVGLIPMVAICVLLIIRLIALIRAYHRTHSGQVLSLMFIKIIILVFGFALSFFPYRYFIVFSLI